MSHSGDECAPSRSFPRPRYEVGEVARAHAAALATEGTLLPSQQRVLQALSRCRTAALGGHLEVCHDCGFERPSYNSCRNRHCPKCQALAQHRWLEARRARILPVHYFHVVFTLPAELRTLWLYNKRCLFALLFKAASRTLQQLAQDPKRLGARIGFTAVLHTWSRDLSWHPHLHCVVTGGGLDPEGQWRSTEPGYLLPVRVLGALFRGKILDALRKLHKCGELQFHSGCAEWEDPERFALALDRLYRKRWVVYCKPPFAGADSVYAYLGRYTHRVGLANSRLLHVDEQLITFRTRADKKVSLPPTRFLRRFLLHVLPKGFVRIRHYGLLAPVHVHGALVQAHHQLQPRSQLQPPATEDKPELPNPDPTLPEYLRLYMKITGRDLRRCPQCASSLSALPLPDCRSP